MYETATHIVILKGIRWDMRGYCEFCYGVKGYCKSSRFFKGEAILLRGCYSIEGIAAL